MRSASFVAGDFPQLAGKLVCGQRFELKYDLRGLGVPVEFHVDRPLLDMNGEYGVPFTVNTTGCEQDTVVV